MKTNEVYDIFISYRREGGESFAMLLFDRLTHAGYRVFLDVESLNSGKFNEAILSKIHECTDMLVVLPPNALDRCVNKDDWVRLEIECALENKKNIIPMMLRGFSWPDQLPESIAELPKYNGVSANSTELIDGVLLRLQTKLLKSKPHKLPLSEKDAAFSRKTHRLQFLLECGNNNEARKLIKQMENEYPDRPEIYLYKIQVYFHISDWKQLGQQINEFASYPEWKYAYRIASPELREEMEKVLREYDVFCQKYEEEQARQAEIERQQWEELRLRQEEAQRQEEERIRQDRINRVRPSYEKAMQQCEQLKQQPVLPAQYELLWETRNLLIFIDNSIGDLVDTSEAREFCEKHINKITESAEAIHEKARIVLSNCVEAERSYMTIFDRIPEFFFECLPPFRGSCKINHFYLKCLLYLPFVLLFAIPVIISVTKKHFSKISWQYVINKTDPTVAGTEKKYYLSSLGGFYITDDHHLGVWGSTSLHPLSWENKFATLLQFKFGTRSKIVLLPTGQIAWLDSQNNEKTIDSKKLIAYFSNNYSENFALLEDGRIVLFSEDEKYKVYRCPATEKIVQEGISNFPMNAAQEVIAMYRKKAGKRLLSKKRRQEYEEIVRNLEELVGKALQP